MSKKIILSYFLCRLHIYFDYFRIKIKGGRDMYKMKVLKHEVDFYIDLKESSGETFIAARPLPGKENMVEMIFVK